jgi:hypothetical protein
MQFNQVNRLANQFSSNFTEKSMLRSLMTDKKDFLKILRKNLVADSQIPFDLYSLQSGEYKIMSAKSEIITQQSLDLLERHGIEVLYILRGEQESLKAYMVEHKQSESISTDKDLGEDRVTSFDNDWESAPPILKDVFDWSPEFRFWTKLHNFFDNISEKSVLLAFIKIGELYKDLLIDFQNNRADDRVDKLMKLSHKQMEFLDKLKADLGKAQDELARFQREKEANKQTIDVVSSAGSDISNAEYLKQIAELKTQIKDNADIVEKAKNKNKILDAFMSENDKYLNELEKEANDNKEMVKDLRDKLESLQDKYSKSQVEHDEAVSDMLAMKEQVKKMKDETNHLHSLISTKNHEVKNLTAKLEDRSIDLSDELNKKQAEVVKLQQLVDTKDATVKKVLGDMEKMKAHQVHTNQLKKQLADKIEQFKQIKKSYHVTQDQLEAKIQALKNMDDKSKKMIKSLTKMNQDLKKRAA